jgi:hypothetical protein
VIGDLLLEFCLRQNSTPGTVPDMMLMLPGYCYAAEAAARYICGNRARPGRAAICRFRNENREVFKEAFTKVPVMAQETGCLKRAGNISVDGTKTHANANRRKAASYRRAGKGGFNLRAGCFCILYNASSMKYQMFTRERPFSLLV